MITIASEGADAIDGTEVADLYDAVGWSAYTNDLPNLMRAMRGSHRIVTARDGGRLVGLARSISDGATIVYVQDILVRPGSQRKGIGENLMATLLGQYDGVRQKVLITDDEDRQRAFYEAIGFREVHDMRPELRAFVNFR